ncbi:TPA: hypothetical protein ACF5HI_004629 [Salmonella enterica]
MFNRNSFVKSRINLPFQVHIITAWLYKKGWGERIEYIEKHECYVKINILIPRGYLVILAGYEGAVSTSLNRWTKAGYQNAAHSCGLGAFVQLFKQHLPTC